ncbi:MULTISPECIES: dTDP-4-amino-4,6-dideoxygalactose transaminase [Gordonibacter]|uniref:dTDP-4-amino-4,6-dideoxygalactose transaminase n=2 Tax=Gordonibacter TaxID=644652 RepID=A0A423ULJ3_9ACTN|nr:MULTISPECIES: dTDP-4-amino-4,6-dideoxygalactose transaminase [Gordonibacter]MZI82795.1 dTDP-4-amino-4,6-dideoxygalactose transaminase [Clostridium butyricum]MDN4509924.1 dTDP-4-amino-4,6-dideoxygalactose transaminase [Gordonibacter sp. RACS_AR49]MSA61675.1 dTDP-4-amino-4,6-dideoxygalactose transaminase [Gordonibacter pamelaeae]MSA94616.1 dTDP-4-amino-4,6-dideoxygalactose transaminase [Gordonibacter urolithinfaciens]ROT90583.1 dTDP-4-amino-4,6-dideoxygalactose transaminase [Gordonibacter uro
MINFNEPPFVGTEFVYLEQAIRNKKICGDGVFTKRCNAWLEDCTGAQKALLTTSGTAALEMAALLCDIEPGDEVILPSYTFSSTATAFVLAGARLVFVDIRPDTMNIDERMIEAAVSDKTKAIVVVHYAGVSCEMDAIMDLASEYNLRIVEDAAQGIMSLYKGRPLGSIGDFGCYSFHETKNYSMGEGGALLIADEKHNEPAEVLREKGTNRSRFFRGQVDKYTWVGYGSSYLPSDLNAAYLWAQLERADDINENRLAIWNRYYHAFVDLADQEIISLPVVPKECVHNAHMFYMKCRGLSERTALIAYLRDRDVQSTFHYIPLHSAPAGRKFGRFAGDDVYTTAESERIVRLPMYYGLAEEDQDRVIEAVRAFFASSLTSKRKE